jgi:DNA-binding winged helix-turn-helix (wHTH) protein
MALYQFGRFRVDPVKRLLFKDGVVLRTEPKTFDVLLALLEHAGQTVQYPQLIAAVWRTNAPGRTEDNLKERVSRLRKALDDDRRAHQFVVTVPLEGYKFVAPVTMTDDGPVVEPLRSTGKTRAIARDDMDAKPGVYGDTSAKTSGDRTRAGGGGTGPRWRGRPVRPALVIPLVGFAIVLAGLTAGLRTVVTSQEAVRHRSIVSRLDAAPLTDHTDELLHAYEYGLDVLRRNLFQQFVIVVLAILIVLRPTDEVALPHLQVFFPIGWPRFVLAAMLIYVWLNFGFVLDDLIKWRVQAWKEVAATGDLVRASAFNDGGFMDGWFMCFRPAEHAINTNFVLGSAFFFSVVYYPLFAANHACAVLLLRTRARSIWLAILPWLAGSAILASHLQFWLGGPNPNWGQPVVIGLALVIASALDTSRHEKVANRQDELPVEQAIV